MKTVCILKHFVQEFHNISEQQWTIWLDCLKMLILEKINWKEDSKGKNVYSSSICFSVDRKYIKDE
jgi:hypothetical protein